MNRRTFVKNTAVMTISSLLLRSLGIVFRIFISNRVGAEGMGLYQLVFSVYVLGTAFAAAGLTTAVTRMAAEALARSEPETAFRVLRLSIGLSLCIGIVSAGALYGFAAPLSRLIGDSRAQAALAVSGIALPFIGVSSCLKGYFMARRRATPPSVAQIVEQLTRIGGILLMLWLAKGCSLAAACRIIILGDALSETVCCFWLTVAYRLDRHQLRQALPVTSAKSKRHLLRPLLTIAVPLTAGRYLTTGLRTAENVLVPAMLTRFTLSDTRSLEQFGAVKGMALPLLFFPAAFLVTVSNLLVPELSDAHALGQKRQVAKLTEQALHITLLGALLIGGLFTVFGRELGRCLYHDETVGLLLQILGPLTPVMYLDTVATGLLRGLGEQVHSLWYSVADSVLRLTLIPLLLPRFGITGFLFVMLLSNLLTAFLSAHRLLTVSGSRFAIGHWLLAPGLAILLSGSGYAALRKVVTLPEGWVGILLGGVMVTVVYLVLLPLLGGITDEDIRRLPHRKMPQQLSA